MLEIIFVGLSQNLHHAFDVIKTSLAISSRHGISEKNQIVDSHPQEKVARCEVKGLPRRGISDDKKATR